MGFIQILKEDPERGFVNKVDLHEAFCPSMKRLQVNTIRVGLPGKKPSFWF